MSLLRIFSASVLIAVTGLGLSYGAAANQNSGGKHLGAVNAARLNAGKEDTADWLTTGRTYDGQRFSPLKQITDKNITQLKPAWQFVLNSSRGQEETPLVVDGVIYVTTAWSEVYALDARTGKKLWYYDPKVPRDWSLNSCCGPINRGAAFWNGKVYAGTLNGHLVALDAKTGKVVWDTFTFPSDAEYAPTGTPVQQYTMAGAPLMVKGKVIIGSGGGDKGVRGYISAYDAETGKMVWRFYTVPDPSKPPENAALAKAKALESWNGDIGGGADVWDGISYDPELDLLYFGTGNPTKGPRGIDGDRLFGDSIVAVRPDTGEYVWHYQEVPDDAWDYDATSPMILADIEIGNGERKVLIHAPKNGFVYVLDRATGELLSAQPLFDKVDWATSIDLTTGRPVENPLARSHAPADGKQFVVMPGPLGGHSWQAMSFSPLTGLVYIPVMEMPNVFVITPNVEKDMPQKPGEPDWKYEDEVIAKVESYYSANLTAWDPEDQRVVWRNELKGLWHGGTLVTAGNLVFQGTSTGELSAYQADTGKKVWSASIQTAIIAPPVSYQVGNDQYIAVVVGWGGSLGLLKGPIGMDNHVPTNLPRVIAFKLNGTYTLPNVPSPPTPTLNPPADTATPEQIASGKAQYGHCLACHGYWGRSAGDAPDLRYSAMVYDRELLGKIVSGGQLRSAGMPMFGPELSSQQLDDIRAYLIHQANGQVAREKAEKQQGN